jgi:hypothetical protein
MLGPMVRAVNSTRLSRLTSNTVVVEGEYTEEQYVKLKRKIDMYLLPLMWLCCT